jgi:hypothetical protein
MLLTGQLSPNIVRQEGAQALLARGQLDSSAQDSKHKFQTKATDEWHVLHDKKMNDTLSSLG